MEAPRPARPMQGQSSIYPQADKGERSGGYGTLLTDADLAPERETAKEPAKRWRNKWRVASGRFDWVTVTNELDLPDGDYGPGEHWGRIWPGLDAAQTAAELLINSPWIGEVTGRDDDLQHVGAFPVDESGEPL